MSNEFTSSLPTQPPCGEKLPAGGNLKSMPVPDLSTLRKGWSNQGQELPSLPAATASKKTGIDQNSPRQTPIPDLPAMGAMASKAALAMEGYTELFGEKPPSSAPPISAIPIASSSSTSGGNDIMQDILTSEASIFATDKQQKSLSKPTKPLDTPRIPVTTFSQSDASQVSNQTTTALSAMPIMAEPKVSIPLVRDQFVSAAAPEGSSADAYAPELIADTATSSAEPPEKTATTKHDQSAKNPSPATFKQTPQQTPDYTDQDLQEALRPIIEPNIDKLLYTPTHGIHTYLEPMLRSTVRRAIAEQMQDASPFREVSGWDKFAWKMRALMGSHTYEDIVFDHTKRYQVEEVFLLRPHTRSLISYASHDPSRHTNPNKVQGIVKKIAEKTAAKDQENEGTIKWENNRTLMVRKGKHCVLAAIVHGSSNVILRSDLDYALRQAEERFGKTLEDESDIHLQILQPLLEGCLLIQSPAIPN